MMTTMRYERMTKAQLIAELKARDSRASRERDLEMLNRELRMHQEEVEKEVRAQHARLLEAQQELEASRDRYANLYDFAPVAYVTLDRDGMITEINLTGARLVERERARIVGTPFHVYIVREERRAFLDYLRRCRTTTMPGSREFRLETRTGTIIPVQLTCRRSEATDGQDHFLNVVITDLRELKHAEAQRRKSAQEEEAARLANEAKDRFLAMLSHELRTPLTPILLGVHILESAAGVPEQWMATLEMIRRNVELEARLIDDLLDVTRIVRGKLRMNQEVVDVHVLVRDLLEVYSNEFRAADLDIAVRLDAEHCHVHGDSTRLRQVFWNLFKNAIQATPRGGKIIVRSCNEVAGHLTVSVSDTGRGIDAAGLERIFLPFEQAHGTSLGVGLGLGLTICKGLVEAHGGRIRASSRGAGQGATFEVELPLVSPPVAAAADAVTLTPALPSIGMRILLVEDDADTADMLSTLLAQRGYEVHVAHSLGEARARAGEKWDVLVTDLGLPDGSGLELLREFEAVRPVKAIVMSGHGKDEDIRESMAAGFRDHLIKPVSFQHLVESIERVAAAE